MLRKLDLFGSSILLRFQGEHTYNTRFGSFFTLLIVGFISFRLFFIIKDVFQRTSPQVIYNERQIDDPAPFEVNNFTFPLAFGMQHPITFENYIDESIYTINALWQQKKLVLNPSTNILENQWVQEKLQIRPCKPENFGNEVNKAYFLKLRYESMYCLPPDLVRIIQGDFNSDVYSEVKFQIMKCTQNCKSEPEMKYFLDKATFAIQISDVYIDPNSKNDPFKSFSRNLYWDTSTKLPKDVNIFLRNNYIQSDFGWITEDIVTQSFPSYSFQDVSYYPESYQTNYFLQVLFRMEKQKEALYQRKYKNLNNIISEIGGFTQSLLAVGILICTRVSQLHLNQEIINEAFNYEESTQQPQKDGSDELDSDSKTFPRKFSSQNVNNLAPDQNNGSNRNIQMGNINKKIINPAAIPQIGLSAMNENLLQLSYAKQGQESCSVSMVQDPNMSPNFQSQNKKNLQMAKIPQTNFTVTSQQQNAKVQSQVAGAKNNKHILNYLIQDNQVQQQNITPPELIDSTSPQEEKIQKLKQKILEEEMKLKENKFKQLMEAQTKSMKMSVWEYFKSMIWPFGKLKEKKQIINYSIEKLYYNLDIFNIVKRLIEVEKLKRLLLDSDQIKLFDYLPKPTIHSDYVLKQMKDKSSKQYEVDVLYQDNRTEMQKAKDAFQAYKKIISKQQNSILDEKLINLLDPNLIAVFEAQNRAQTQVFSPQRQLYNKQDSPVQFAPKQNYMEQNSEQINQQDISGIKNQEKLLNNEVISPRIQIQAQPILQLNNPQQESSMQRSQESMKSQLQQQLQTQLLAKANIQKQLMDLENSEIAMENAQQYPQELFKSERPSISKRIDDD